APTARCINCRRWGSFMAILRDRLGKCPVRGFRPGRIGAESPTLAAQVRLLNALPDRHGGPAGRRFRVLRLPFIRQDSHNGAFLSGAPDIREDCEEHCIAFCPPSSYNMVTAKLIP